MKYLRLPETDVARPGWAEANSAVGLRLTWIAWGAVAALAIGLAAAGVPARFRELMANTGQPLAPRLLVTSVILALNVTLTLLFFGAALWIARLKGRAPVALFLSLTLLAIGATETGLTGALANPEHGTSLPLVRWAVLGLGALTMVGAVLLLFAFPDGHFIPGWGKWLVLAWALMNLIWLVFPALPFNPIHGSTWRATPLDSFAVGVVVFGAGILAQVHRYRRISDVASRQQTKWTVLGLAGAVAGGVLYYGLLALAQDGRWSGDQAFLAYLLVRPALQTLFMALLPLCLAIAIMRYHLFDIDIILNRALVYGALTVAVIAIYIAVVGTLGALFENGSSLLISLVATGLVAVAFQPLRERLQRAANRLVYGEREEPYAVLARLGRRLEATTTPQATLDTVVETIAQALKIPCAAIALFQDGQPVVVARYPADPGESAGAAMVSNQITLPLTYGGDAVGQLLLMPRAPDAPFGVADRRLLEDIARQAGVVAHAVQLQFDLQTSRQRLVTAREEERRRLRRDLHDGLGPALASLALKTDAARDELAYDVDSAAAMLVDLKQDIQASVGEIRRLVYNLRPPALDDLGLLAALGLLATHYESRELAITLDLPQELPPLTAAAELAVYRISAEALTNVVRHADAHRCLLRLTCTEQLLLQIEDDGSGMAPNVPTGVGLVSMRERAAELGGCCTVTSSPGAGTRVQVSLPLMPVPPHETA